MRGKARGRGGSVSDTLSLHHGSPCGLLDIHWYNGHWVGGDIKEQPAL